MRGRLAAAGSAVAMLLLTALQLIGHPYSWVDNYGCGTLMSGASLGSGMGGGYSQQGDSTSHTESNGAFALTMPSGRWFVTAGSGTFSGTGSMRSGCSPKIARPRKPGEA